MMPGTKRRWITYSIKRAMQNLTNQTKTAASWGVKIKVKLLRGSAEGDCYIQSVGGNFA